MYTESNDQVPAWAQTLIEGLSKTNERLLEVVDGLQKRQDRLEAMMDGKKPGKEDKPVEATQDEVDRVLEKM